jgi:integrase
MQARDRLAAGAFYRNDDGAIFTDELGRRLAPGSTTAAFARIARRAGISTTRLHDLRHTAASALIVDGTDVRTTASVLGHSTPSVTLSVYAHLMGEAQRDALDRLGDRIERLAEPASSFRAASKWPANGSAYQKRLLNNALNGAVDGD